MGIIDKIKGERVQHKCGCLSEAEVKTVTEFSKYHHTEYQIKVWRIVRYCKQHTPNYKKREAKEIHLERTKDTRWRIRLAELASKFKRKLLKKN
jgi:hypothetical protein